MYLRKSRQTGLSGSLAVLRKERFQGFVLVELVIAFAIVGTLAAIAIPTYTKYRYKAQIALAVTEIRMMEKEIANYAAEIGDFPCGLDDIGMGDIKDPWGNPYQYLKIADEDPKEDGKGQKKGGKDKNGCGGDKSKARKDHFMVPVNTDYDLYSMGPDGKSKAPFAPKVSRDDIVRANDGQYVGLASEY
jgi:general secretion pathway protein G